MAAAPKPTLPNPVYRARQGAARATQVTVREIRFTGNELFSDEQLHHVLLNAAQRTVSLADIDKLTARIAEHYRSRGYQAHAYSRPESLATGYLEFVVVESSALTGPQARSAPGGVKAYPSAGFHQTALPLRMDTHISFGTARPGRGPLSSLLDTSTAKAVLNGNGTQPASELRHENGEVWLKRVDPDATRRRDSALPEAALSHPVVALNATP